MISRTPVSRAFMEWKQSDQLIIDAGFRKAPLGLEEWVT